ncbi:MAG: DUF885 domain-containing protein [Kangiellaceae bacterium]|nr:DUF885 domain-containing protein [Kangiellaceae bacterium]
MRIKVLIASLLAIVVSSIAQASPSQDLQRLFDKEWQARIDRSPLLATRMGQHQYDHLLMDVSELAYASWAKKTKSFLKELDSIPFEQLSNEDQINYQIFKSQLKRRLSQNKFKTYQIPFLSDSGFHTEVMWLNNHYRLKNLKDYQNYLQRLEAIPVFFQQNIDNMNKGLARGFSMPKVVMIGFTDVIKNAYKIKVEDSSLYEPFKSYPSSFSEKEKQHLTKKAKSVIKNKVFAAFEKVDKYFETEYIPNTKISLGAADFPDGIAYYQSQVEHYTTLDLSAEEIHQIGLGEVARIRNEMEEVIAALKFEGNFKDFLKFLRESPQFYAKTPEELLKEAAYISKKMDGKLPKLFTHLPRQPYAVEPVPDAIAPKYTTGRYVSAPLESERPGVYWVNTYALDKRPLYVLEALTLHEAVPGHHLQHALNYELENLPNFRRYSYISAFGEGWGLYSERLGLEVGFYQDHYSNFGRLTYEMWRAARLVIDTGIHVKGWTREKAIKLLEENSALSTHNIRTEVDRYISWPGQALSYKLGEIKIRELRSKAEESLGDKFDVRKFHDAILKNGSIPLGVLEQQINQFIESSR